MFHKHEEYGPSLHVATFYSTANPCNLQSQLKSVSPQMFSRALTVLYMSEVWWTRGRANRHHAQPWRHRCTARRTCARPLIAECRTNERNHAHRHSSYCTNDVFDSCHVLAWTHYKHTTDQLQHQARLVTSPTAKRDTHRNETLLH
jgi:hypothetical protein